MKKKKGGKRRVGNISISVLLIIISVGAILIINQSTAQQSEAPVAPKVTPMSTVQGTPAPEPTPAPTEISYPKPLYIPSLRSYEIDKSHDIWHAKDPSSYITPDNEWVRYYAKNYDDYQKGIIVPDSEMPNIQYKKDLELYPNDVNKDVWQNPDFTLYTKTGDCEDIAIVWVSIHRALGHKAIVVAGELWFYDGSPNVRDYWYEYIDEFGYRNVKFVTPITEIKEFKAVPQYMFNDKIQWSKYNEN